MADRPRRGDGGDVDLWEHVRYDDTVRMTIDEDEVAAALALAASSKPPASTSAASKSSVSAASKSKSPTSAAADSQSVDDLLAEIEALADDDETDDDAEPPEPSADATDDGDGEDDADAPDDAGSAVVRLLTAAPPPSDGEGPGDDGEGSGDGPGEDGDALALHPRMRDRRIAVLRDEGRRRLRRLAWGIAGLTLVVDGAALAHTPFADVDHIVVEGSTKNGDSTIRWASGIEETDALLTLDEHGAEASIERLSWVATADVKREWPSTVRIVVHERVPAAVLQSAPGLPLAVVDAEGRVLQIGGSVPPGLVTITGVPRKMREGRPLPASARDALTLALAAPALVPGAVTTVSQTLEATLTSGGVVRFGSIDDLDEKLATFAAVLARVDTSCLGVLDVKVPGSATVSRGPC